MLILQSLATKLIRAPQATWGRHSQRSRRAVHHSCHHADQSSAARSGPRAPLTPFAPYPLGQTACGPYCTESIRGANYILYKAMTRRISRTSWSRYDACGPFARRRAQTSSDATGQG